MRDSSDNEVESTLQLKMGSCSAKKCDLTNSIFCMEKISTTCNVRVKRCSTVANISHESSDEEQKQNTSHNRASKKRTSSQGSAKNPDSLCSTKRSSGSDDQSSNTNTSNLLQVCSSSEVQSHNNGAAKAPNSPADDTSCISKLNATNTMAEDCGNDFERKNNGSGSSASINSFPPLERAFDDPQNSLDKTSTNSEESVINHVEKPMKASEPSVTESSKSPTFREPSPKGEASVCSKEKEQNSSTTMPFGEESDISEHPETKEGKERQLPSKDQSCTLELPPPSQSALISNESDLVDEEVGVCDICGDVGREYLLAICTNCNDGAEHIYCMRVKMDKVPASDWVCEDCKFNQESGIEKEKKVEGVEKLLKRAYPMGVSQKRESFGPSNLKKRLKIDIRASGFEKKTANAVSCSPKLPSKISSTNSEVLPLTKKRLLETHDESPKGVHPQKMLYRSGSSLSPRNISEGKVKPFPLSGSSKTLFSVRKSRLLKSKSFNIGDNRVKDCQLQQGSERKSVVSKDHDKGGHNKIFRKSLSFKDSCTELPVPDISKAKKMLSPTSPLGKDQIRVRKTEDHSLRQQKSSPKVGSLSADDKRNARNGELPPKLSTTANYHDRETTHGHANLSNSSKLGRCPLQKDSGDHHVENYRIANHEKAESGCKDNELDANGSSRRHYLDNSIPPQEGIIPQLDFIWKGVFEVSRSEGLTSLFPCIQAHKSNRACERVDAAVMKMPQKIVLDEAPRLSIWPAQFKDSQATEDNIALFFFAENFESYETYESLLKHITANDLALKGYLDGVELLIFSSKVLPPESQRWNNFLYLWGVFRATSVGFPENEKTSQNRLCSPGRATNCTSPLPSNLNGLPLASPRSVNELPEPVASSSGTKSSPLQAIDHQLSDSSTLLFLVGERDPYKLDLEFGRDITTRYLSVGASCDEYPDKKMKGIVNGPSEPCSHLSTFLEAAPAFYRNDSASTSGSKDIENAAIRIPGDYEKSVLEDVNLDLSLGPPINESEKGKALSLSLEAADDRSCLTKRLSRNEDGLSLSLSLSLS